MMSSGGLPNTSIRVRPLWMFTKSDPSDTSVGDDRWGGTGREENIEELVIHSSVLVIICTHVHCGLLPGVISRTRPFTKVNCG